MSDETLPAMWTSDPPPGRDAVMTVMNAVLNVVARIVRTPMAAS